MTAYELMCHLVDTITLPRPEILVEGPFGEYEIREVKQIGNTVYIVVKDD